MEHTHNRNNNKSHMHPAVLKVAKKVKENAPADSSRFQNYMSIVAIVPALLSITAYEFVDFMLYHLLDRTGTYNPLDGLGILTPMALMMELFTYFLTKKIIKKVNQLTSAMHTVAKGNYNIRLDTKRMVPLAEMSESFNQMAEDLSSVETLRTDFINDFSHEFKTPIVSINGFAKLLLEEDLSEEDKKEYLTIIADESERLANLAQQTMLMSKLDTQIKINEASIKTFSLDEQIRRCIILLQNSWSSKNIDMQIDLDTVRYISDPTLIEHIWINLMNNAIKFTPENGTIHVSLREVREGANNYIEFKITDSGCGMTQNEANHIFNKYYQADTSHSGKGLGLGLAICRRVITLCSGEISVDSTVDVGTTFTVTLPVTV
ncbi:MAG: HAMP domain-containing histidine kinase [Lachnospiraceae bacterium]|nr:HAMP domain-containing histidine kinase [Lachnospiraceae bacterium]